MQVPVREDMHKWLQLLLRILPIATQSTHKNIPRLKVSEHGHAVHSRPDPSGWAALQPDATLAIAQDHQLPGFSPA
jgi:hypothetical protein